MRNSAPGDIGGFDYRRIKSWIFENDLDPQAAKEISLSHFTSEYRRGSFLSTWLQKEGNNFEPQDAKEIARLHFKNEHSRFEFLLKCLLKVNFNSRDAKEIVLLLSDDSYKIRLITEWVERGRLRGECNNFEPQDAKEIALSHFFDEEKKLIFIYAWLQKEGNNFEQQDVEEVASSLSSRSNKISFLKSWLLRKNENNLEREYVKDVIKFSTSGSSEFIKVWLLGKQGNNFAPKDVVEILHLFQDDNAKKLLMEDWRLKKQNGLAVNNLTDFLLEWDDPRDVPIIKALLEKSGNSVDDLKKFLSQLSTEFLKPLLVSEWLKEQKKLESSDIEEVMSLLPEDEDKVNFIKEWIEKDPEQKYSAFVMAVDKEWLCNRYNYETILLEYHLLKLPIENLRDLCEQLYPNYELLRVELFGEFVSWNHLKGEEGKSLLKSFIYQLQDDENVLSILTLASREQDLRFPELEILELTSNRLSKKYEAIKDALSGKSLLESLTSEGLATVRVLFGKSANLKSKTLADLFSYYDVKNEIVNFKSVVAPKVLQKIAAAYAPNSKMSYLVKGEYEKLRQLFNSKDYRKSKLELPQIKILADYLKSKVPPIPAVNVEQFQFGESEILSLVKEEDLKVAKEQSAIFKFITEEDLKRDLQRQRKSKFTQDFKKLLTKGRGASYSDVAIFFQNILGLEKKIKEEDREKLGDFFRNNQNELAFLFQQKDGLDKFAGVIGALGDGCVANITTQAKIALYQSIIPDPCDQVLFAVFHEKISAPILNSGDDHLGGSSTEGTDIFTNPVIRDSLISPAGLVAALQEEFFKDGKKVRDSWEFLKSKMTEEERNDLSEALLKSNPNDFEAAAAKVVTYVILKSAAPELLKSKYLKVFKEFCEPLIEKRAVLVATTFSPSGSSFSKLIRNFCAAISGQSAAIPPATNECDEPGVSVSNPVGFSFLKVCSYIFGKRDAAIHTAEDGGGSRDDGR